MFPCAVFSTPPRPPLKNSKLTKAAAKIAADAAKKAVEAAKRAAKKAVETAKRDAAREARNARRSFKIAVFESLEPFGVKVCNRTYFRGSNWETETVNLCKKCGEPEPKNGCWCMQHK
jgi:hypothetical protein